MSRIRMEKINSELAKCIYEIITRQIKNADLTEMVSVTRVDTDPDLKNAKVFVSVFGEEERAEATFAAVRNSAGFIRRQLAGMMKLRTVPSLHFVRDDSMAYSMKINKLIDEVLHPDSGPKGEN